MSPQYWTEPWEKIIALIRIPAFIGTVILFLLFAEEFYQGAMEALNEEAYSSVLRDRVPYGWMLFITIWSILYLFVAWVGKHKIRWYEYIPVWICAVNGCYYIGWFSASTIIQVFSLK